MTKKKMTAFEKNQKEYNDFVKSLEGKTTEELGTIEQDLIKEIDKHDAKVAKTEFKVIDSEKLAEAVDIAHHFLNKQKCQFNYAVAMKQLYDSFNKDLKTLPYPVYDMLLTTLGGMEFSGYDEWDKIIKFNEFAQDYNDEYAELKAKTYRLAEEHSTLQSKMGLSDATASNTATTSK